MTAGAEASRAIVGAMVGLLYGSVLALLSLFLFGGGGAHGTSIPLLLSSAPLGVFALVGKLVGEPYMGYGDNATVLGAPLVWAGLGWLVALSGRGRLRTRSDPGSVALCVRARAHRDGRRGAGPFGAPGANIAGARYVGDDLPGWASGVVVKHEGWPRSEAGDCWSNGRPFVWLRSRVSVIRRDRRWSRQHRSLIAVISAAWRPPLGRQSRWCIACRRGDTLRNALWYTADMDGARVGGCAVRPWDEPQPHSGSGSVAVRVGPRARRDDSRLAYRFSCRSVESAAVGRYVGDGLPGWAGGVVVANKQAQSTSTDRLTTACGRNSRSRHRNDLRSQTALPKQTQQNRLTAPVPVAPQQSSENAIW